LKVLIVTEYYPRAGDPVRGVWVHHQALAARRAGAQVRVMVLHRPLPPLAALRSLDVKAMAREMGQPGRAELDGIEVEYLRYLSPPRPRSYASWGAWAAPLLSRKLGGQDLDLVHAHYAVPSGDAVRRAAPEVPLVVSVHGHDVQGAGGAMPAVSATLAHARVTLANSTGTAARCTALGARHTQVVHLGSDLPSTTRQPPSAPVLITVGHLVARKRHADVIAAVALLRRSHPGLRYVIVGDGPERGRLSAQATSLGLTNAIEFRGALRHEEAVAAARSASLFVMPSVEEAFGVAYIEAMAGGVPAIGCAGEDGPTEIAACGGGIELVPSGDPHILAQTIDRLLQAPAGDLRQEARETVARAFTWERCGRETVQAYAEAMRNPRC
jgi:glycosyltransferase involved in cell wall biosynthesis